MERFSKSQPASLVKATKLHDGDQYGRRFSFLFPPHHSKSRSFFSHRQRLVIGVGIG